MKNILKGLGAAVSFAAEKVESNAPLIKAKMADVGRSIDVAASASKKIIAEKAAEASELAQRVAADERTQRLVANVSTGLSNAKENITSAITSTVQRQETKSLTGPETVDTPEGQEQTKIVSAIEKLSGRDKVGVSAEVLGAAGGAAAGVAAAGTVAGLAGATTLLGSTGLASLLGGIFVTTTPVGWVIGSAALAGAAGYGLVRMVRSGANQDRTRQEIVKRLSKRLEALQEESTEKDLLLELTQLVAVTLAAGLITEDHGQRIVGLVEKGTLSSKIAVDRIKAIAVEAGVIVPVNPSQISLASPRT